MFTLDSLDNVEEDDKQFFEQTDDGKFKFNRVKLETAAKTPLDKKNRELLAKIAKSKDLDDADIERIKKLKAKPERLSEFEKWLEANDSDGGETEGDDPGKAKKPEGERERYQQELVAQRKKLEAQRLAELESKDKVIADWQQKWKGERLSNTLRRLAIDSGVFKEDLETYLDLLIFKKHFDLTDDAEVVFMKDGEPSATPPDKAMAEDLRKLYKRFYEAELQGGSGADGSGRGSLKGTDWHKLSPEERMAFGRKQQKARA